MIKIKSPQQQIYDTVFALSLKLGYDTYESLPNDAKYPFVYVGAQYSQDKANKSTITGEVTQMISVYNSKGKRRSTTDIVNNLVREIRKITHTDTFYISVKGVRQQVLTESVTPSKPMVGHIEIDFRFN